MFKGTLSSLSLGEIFQSLAVNNHSGTLKITARDGTQKCVYFSKGEISLFSSGKSTSLRLGEILIRQGKLDAGSLGQALEEQKQSGEILGKLLLRKGLITKEDVREALETKIREEIYDLFLLTEAEFEFHLNHLPEEAFDPLQKNTRAAINTNVVILEGLRRVDEWKLIERRIKTFKEIFRRIEGAPADEQDPALADLLEIVDGATPVREIFRRFRGSRFSCTKALYEFAESGLIRPIDVEEAIAAGAAAVEAKDYQRALGLYQYAEQLDPWNAQALSALASCYLQLQKETDALEVLQRATQAYHMRGMHKEALTIAGQFLSSQEKIQPETAETIFRSALIVGDVEIVRSMGNRLLSIAQDNNEPAKAEVVLEELCKISPKDLNLRVELANLCAANGNTARALSHLDETAEKLTAGRKQKELLKVLLLIIELDPGRMAVKRRIQKMMAAQARREKLKQSKVTILGASCIFLLILAGITMFYELKARELFSHAQRLEEISLVSQNFGKVKAAYEEVLRSYSFSSRATGAQQALEWLSTYERIKLENLQGVKTAQEEVQEQKLVVMREALPGLLKEAKLLEDKGEIERAFEIFTRISTEFAEVPGTRGILFPIYLTTSPRGTQVEVNGTALGASPLLLKAQKGEEVSVVLSRSGCETTTIKIVGGQDWKHHVTLNRRPIGEWKLTGPIQQPIVLQGDRFFIPSRDGHLYAVNGARKEVVWRRRVGRFGDLASEISAAAGELFQGTVGGEISPISIENGKARWRARLRSAILAPPAVSPDGRWVAAASTSGDVGIFDIASGEHAGRFQTDDEVIAGPLFTAYGLLVGSTDCRLYVLTVPRAEPQQVYELESGVVTAPVPVGDAVLFGTRDGAVHRLSLSEKLLIWSRPLEADLTGPPVAERDRVFIGTAAGEIIALDALKGNVVWKTKVSSGRTGRLLFSGGRVFVGTESGDFVALAAQNGTREWGFKADTAIAAPPIAIGSHLYVPCSTGKVLIMELME